MPGGSACTSGYRQTCRCLPGRCCLLCPCRWKQITPSHHPAAHGSSKWRRRSLSVAQCINSTAVSVIDIYWTSARCQELDEDALPMYMTSAWLRHNVTVFTGFVHSLWDFHRPVAMGVFGVWKPPNSIRSINLVSFTLRCHLSNHDSTKTFGSHCIIVGMLWLTYKVTYCIFCNRSHTCISFKPPQDHCY